MSLKKYLQHNTPVILSGLASIGVVVTAVTAVKATPKAIQLLEEAEKNYQNWRKQKRQLLHTYLRFLLEELRLYVYLEHSRSIENSKQV